MKEAKAQRGFSLIELMIAIVVIGVLASLAYPKYNEYTLKTKLAPVLNALSICSKEIRELYLLERYLLSHTRLSDAFNNGYVCTSLNGTNDIDTQYSSQSKEDAAFTITFGDSWSLISAQEWKVKISTNAFERKSNKAIFNCGKEKDNEALKNAASSIYQWMCKAAENAS